MVNMSRRVSPEQVQNKFDIIEIIGKTVDTGARVKITQSRVWTGPIVRPLADWAYKGSLS